MSLYPAIAQQLAFVRNKVCPRTAYTTNGSYTDTLNIIHSCSCDEHTTQLKSSIIDNGEFSSINEQSIVEPPIQTENMTLILANNDIPLCVTLAQTYIQNSCLLVWILIRATQFPILELGDDITVIYSVQLEEFYLISIRKKMKLNMQLIGDNSQPPVCARKQFTYLWTNSSFRTAGKQRVLQRLSCKECVKNGSTKYYSKQVWNQFITDWIKSGMDDVAIYTNIRRYTFGEPDLHHTGMRTLPENNGRTNYMVKMLGKCIPRHRKTSVVNYLDYGCAEGAITAEMGKYLNLPKTQIFGADVRAIPDEGFQFIQLGSEHDECPPAPRSILPMMSDSTMSIITCSMVMHHVRHPLQTLRELRRVIRHDGCLIIREHHCDNQEMATVLDIIHGLYSLSWSTPIEWPNFIDEYRARYLSQSELDDVAYQAGFIRITDTKERDIMNLHKVDSNTLPNGKITNIMQAYYATYIPTL